MRLNLAARAGPTFSARTVRSAEKVRVLRHGAARVHDASFFCRALQVNRVCSGAPAVPATLRQKPEMIDDR